MTVDAQDTPPRRGRPRVIDRERIVEAARRLDPEAITMQAVAAELGVHRKALNYHVADRDELLRLVATDTLRCALAGATLETGSDWQQAARDFAHALRHSVIETGRLAPYVALRTSADLAVLDPVELLLTALFDAGFDTQTALSACTMLAELALYSARHAVERAERGEQFERVFADMPGELYPALRRLVDEGVTVTPEHQFEFDVEVCLRGLNDRLRSQGG